MKSIVAAFSLILGACVTPLPTQQCARFLRRMHADFSRLDINNDGKISRQEFQPVIESMQKLADRERTLHNALSDPASFEEAFTYRDKNHDGYLTFDEFSEGVCKNGYLDRSVPSFPKD